MPTPNNVIKIIPMPGIPGERGLQGLRGLPGDEGPVGPAGEVPGGATGSFVSNDNKTVTVTNGIITSIEVNP